MPPRTTTKKPAKNASLVPVLFTLGVIGWGFFAIDRLTSSSTPSYGDYNAEAHDYAVDSGKNASSWKKATESFLAKFSASQNRKKSGKKNDTESHDKPVESADPTGDPEEENWTVVSGNTEAQTVPEQEPQKNPENTPAKVAGKDAEEITGAETSRVSNDGYYLYYYQDIKGHLSLSQIPRKTHGEINLKSIFKEIVSGPAFLRNKRLIDSFPLKPTVIDAYFSGSTLLLNLDDNFGHGISFETAQLQLEQIVKTSSQFKHISSVKFLINGEDVESLHVDGLTIPATFKTNRPVALSRESEN